MEQIFKRERILMKSETNKDIDNPDGCWVKWIGNFSSASGYSEGIRAMMKGFYENDFKMHIAPQTYGPGIKMKKDIFEIYKIFKEADLNKRYITLQTMPPDSFSNDIESYFNIGRTADESSGISDEWVRYCNGMDEIWVPSSFNKSTFIESGVAAEKIFAVPDAIDLDLYNPGIEPLEVEGKRGFNFLSVFDWKLKKGWDILLESFISEFSGSEDVSLLLRTYSFLSVSFEDIKNRISRIIEKKCGKKTNDYPKIILIEKILNQDEMTRLYKACDCFVLPTRGEGWGRPFMEAMAMGLPTVGTKWSGHLDFMNDSNSYLIDCDLVNVPPEGVYELPNFKNKKWANPSIPHLRSMLRYIYENRSDARSIGLKGRDFIRRNFNSKTVTGKIIQRLMEIRDWDKKKFRIIVKQDQKEDFVDYWNACKFPEILNENHHFGIDFLADEKDSGLKEYLSRKSTVNLWVNGSYSIKVPSDCHTVLLLDTGSELWMDLYHGETSKISHLRYNIDDIWISDGKGLKILSDRGISRENIFLIDEKNNTGRNKASEIKKRLVLIKRRPIKRHLEENYLKNAVRNQPYLLKDIRKESFLTFIDFDNPDSIRKLIIDFIAGFSKQYDITLVIVTNPGKAKTVFSCVEEVLKEGKYGTGDSYDIPDIVIFDEVINQKDIIRLINQISYYIPSQSSLNDKFINSTARLRKRIFVLRHDTG